MLAVVEPKVVEPVETRLFVVRVPEIVVDAEFKEETFAFPATIFPRVVDASVDDPATIKFVIYDVVAKLVVAKVVDA